MNVPVNLCYNVIVPTGKKETMIGVRLDETTKRRLEKIVEEEDRSVSYVARELILRGLSLYEIDGKLRGEAPVKAMRQLAPVVARIERGDMTRQQVQRMIDGQETSEAKPRRTLKVPVGGKAR